MSSRTLAARICEAQANVGRVKKNGRNSHFNYDFATEGDIADACREVMQEFGIGMVYLGVVPESITKNGKEFGAVYRYKFVSTDNNDDSFETATYGFAIDSQDKGPPKAMTAAHKYTLIRVFNIATGEAADDPDGAGEIPNPAPKPARKPAKPAADAQPPATLPDLPEGYSSGTDLDDDAVFRTECVKATGAEQAEAMRLLTNAAALYGVSKLTEFKGQDRHRLLVALREGQ